MKRLTNVSIILVLISWNIADAARILGVFPSPSYSNQVVFKSLITELARRGHELVVFTTQPVNDPNLQNYTEVNLREFDDYNTEINVYELARSNHWILLDILYESSKKQVDKILSHPVMQQLIRPNSTEKFDLIIVQCLTYDALYALSIRFGAPLIGISSLPLTALHNYMFGNPLLLAYLPDIFCGLQQDMNLWQRMVNIYYYLRQLYDYLYKVLPGQEKIVKKYFGDSMPPAHKLNSYISMLFVNTYPFYSYSRPNVPEILHIGGCHLVRPKNLSEDLQLILDDAKQGYIYFSLGSNVKSNLLPVEKRNMFLKIFAKLPYKVMWKFESDLVDKPNNVIVRKWLPQKEILTHPNIRLFMYQGGLQSTEEAIDSEVPVIGFPVLSDQSYNMNLMQTNGVGKMLDIYNLNEEVLENAIFEVITNASYKENMVKLRSLLQDVPHNSKDKAVWWTEHVIRHKGAPHLRNKSRDMPWYQVQLLDIAAISLVAVILSVYIIAVVTRCTFKICVRFKRQIRRNRDTKKQQ